VLLGGVLPRTSTVAEGVLREAAIAACMLVVILAIERAARRFLPLAALLNLSLLFPDQAPKRFAVARRVARPRDLERQLQEARTKGNAGGEVASMQTVLELVAALSVHDKQTRGHSERVRVLTDLIAEEMKLPAADRARLRWASLLHDIGKLLVPSDILKKTERLDDAEWQTIRRHPEEGARFVAGLKPWLGEWAHAVEHHHERWDGRGYPLGLSGEQISLGGRIVGVADAYETMTASRPYRRALGVVAARQELVRCSGAQFDPAVVRAFLNVSVGRLWRAVGIGTWLAELPLLSPLRGLVARLGLPAGAGAMAGTVAGGLALAGLLPGPVRALPTPGSPPLVASAAGAASQDGASAGSGGASRKTPTDARPGAATSKKGPAPAGGGQAGPSPAQGTSAGTTQPSGSSPSPSSLDSQPPDGAPAARGPGSTPTPSSPSSPPATPSPSATPTPAPSPTPTPSPPPSPPVVSMPQASTVSESSTYTATGSFSNPGAQSWSAVVDYGDGSGTQVLPLSGTSFTLSHTYSEACGCSARVSVTNDRAATGQGSVGITVNSAAPVVSVSGGIALLGGFNSTASFLDGDTSADTFTATVDYGDGSGIQPLVVSGTHLTLSHHYGLLGTFTVMVTVIDDDGARGSATAMVTAV
jgi:putative nucleotidyltransferase with HDIG domain